jgi:hypothetical protein
MEMTVAELIERLKKFDPQAKVLMTMDWSGSRDLNKPIGQWEDELGDVALTGKGKYVHLLNKFFK